jgi:cell division protein FtsB
MTAVLRHSRVGLGHRIDDGTTGRATVRPEGRSAVALVVFGFFATLLALAAFQSVVLSGQFDFDNLQRRLEDGRDRSQLLRAEVARLETPGRILEVAGGRLGLVTPEERFYLPSVVPGDPEAILAPPVGDPFSRASR